MQEIVKDAFLEIFSHVGYCGRGMVAWWPAPDDPVVVGLLVEVAMAVLGSLEVLEVHGNRGTLGSGGLGLLVWLWG